MAAWQNGPRKKLYYRRLMMAKDHGGDVAELLH